MQLLRLAIWFLIIGEAGLLPLKMRGLGLHGLQLVVRLLDWLHCPKRLLLVSGLLKAHSKHTIWEKESGGNYGEEKDCSLVDYGY